MALILTRQRIDWPIVDFEGQTGVVGFYSLSFEDPNDQSVEFENLRLALRGVTDGAVNVASFSESLTENAAEAATAGAYQNKEDKMVLLFKSAKNNTVRFEVPAPNATVFLADNETVDKIDALVAALITAILNFAADKAGNALILFLRGFRKRAKTSLK